MKLCPFCLDQISSFDVATATDGKTQLYSCPSCHEPIPLLYATRYDSIPPVVVSLMGATRHGKTVYVCSLFYEFERLGQYWPDFAYSPLDREGLRDVQSRLISLRAGKLPDASQRIFPRPVILHLQGIPQFGQCRLLMYDTSGEAFEDNPEFNQYGNYTTHGEGAIWLVSLDDVTSPLELENLLRVYEHGLVERNIEPRQRKLVIALTKADRLLKRERLPAELRDLLTNNRLPGGSDMYQPTQDLCQGLEDLSRATEAWLNQENYHNFVRLARTHFGAVKFTVVSALGSEPKGQQQLISVRPRGVLLPLLWLWIFHTRPVVTLANGSQSAQMLFSLEQAIAQAPAGATITLEPREYQLAQPLTIDRPLTLVSSGAPGQTRLVCAAEDCVLRISGVNGFTARGIHFHHQGPAWGHVLRIASSRIELEQCIFSGGIWDRDNNHGGNGIKVTGDSTGTIRNCSFHGNHQHGIYLLDNSALELIGNTATSNRGCGLVFSGRSRSTARNNTCERNTKHGLYVAGQAEPVLEGNTCTGNRMSGITFADSAQGEARNNQCVGSEMGHGICVMGQARPILEKNRCRNNEQAGLAYLGNAGGIARGNECHENNLHGIYVGGSCKPQVEKNVCTQNVVDGLHITTDADPRVISNTCRNNAKHDIRDLRSVKPTVRQ